MPADVKKALAAIGVGGALTALTILFGRLWAQSYYSVFGLPTEDLELDVWDYAFRTKEILVLFFVGAAVAGTLVFFPSAREHVTEDRDLPQPRISRPVHKLSNLGDALLFIGIPLFIALFYVALDKPTVADDLWGPHNLLGFLGGLSLGLVLGLATNLVRNETGLWRAAYAIVVLAFLTVLIPWLTTELAEFKAQRDIRRGLLPQAVIEFEQQAPVAIRRTDDPVRSDVVHLVFASKSRVAVAYPFGCESVGIQGSTTNDLAALQSDTCDIFTFDRDEIRSIRVFGKGTQRPFNDEPASADVVELAPDAPTDFDKIIDLTAARSDRCGGRSADASPDDPNLDTDLAHGVWYQLNAIQSGRLVVDPESAPVFLSAGPVGTASECRQAVGGEADGWRLIVGDTVFLLASSPRAGDRIKKRLRFLFVPLDFRLSDDDVVAPRSATPFAVLSPSRVAVTVSGPRAFELAEDCEPLKSGRVTVAPVGQRAGLALCPRNQPKPGARSVTFRLPTPLVEGIWELRVNVELPGLQSYRIRLTR